jgi:hypothetical protein
VFVNWFLSLMQGTSYTVVLMTRHILIYCYITGFITTEDASKERGSCDNYIYSFWHLHYLVSLWYKPLVFDGGMNSVPGRAIAHAVSRRPVAAEARVHLQVSPCGIFGGQSGTGTGFSPCTLVFFWQYRSACASKLIRATYQRHCVILATYSVVKWHT